jgi:hypothetical protein
VETPRSLPEKLGRRWFINRRWFIKESDLKRFAKLPSGVIGRASQTEEESAGPRARAANVQQESAKAVHRSVVVTRKVPPTCKSRETLGRRTGLICHYTAEVAGSIPAPPTAKPLGESEPFLWVRAGQ